MLYNSVIHDKSRIFLLHEGMLILLLPESSCAYEFTTCKQVAKCKKITDGYTKYSQKHPIILQDYGICKFSELIPTIHSSQKFIMLGKTNMSLSNVISLRSAGFIQSSYTLYHISSVIIQNFTLAITWYKIHNGDCTSIFQVEKLSKLIYYLIQINKARNNTH